MPYADRIIIELSRFGRRAAHPLKLCVGAESAILGCEKIRSEVEILAIFGVAGNATGIDKLSRSKAAVHNPGPRQNIAGFKLPLMEIVRHCVAVKLEEDGVCDVVGVASPHEYSQSGDHHVEICRQVVPEVVVTDIVGGRGLAV